MQVSQHSLVFAGTERGQNSPVRGNEPSETTRNGSVWYSNMGSLLRRVEGSGARSRPQRANPLAQALKNSQCHRYSIPEKDPRFCSESVLTRFVLQLCCYSSTYSERVTLFQSRPLSIVQMMTERSICSQLGCFFVLILGDKPGGKPIHT